jgi:hypothetical protein
VPLLCSPKFHVPNFNALILDLVGLLASPDCLLDKKKSASIIQVHPEFQVFLAGGWRLAGHSHRYRNRKRSSAPPSLTFAKFNTVRPRLLVDSFYILSSLS